MGLIAVKWKVGEGPGWVGRWWGCLAGDVVWVDERERKCEVLRVGFDGKSEGLSKRV